MARIKILSTGGTIASKVDPATGGARPALSGRELLDSVPGLADVAEIEVENVCSLPGFGVYPDIWLQVAERARVALHEEGFDGVVVTHGTDTMEETAFFLDLTVAGDKPVVLTGAQRNASYFDPDGPRNLLNAVMVAASPKASGQGAMIVFNGKINAARDVTKVHTSHVEAFQSYEHGYLGTVEMGAVRFHRRRMERQLFPIPEKLPRVDIIPTYPGHDDLFFQAVIRAGSDGAIVQAYGLGNGTPALQRGVESLLSAGIPTVIASRVPMGVVAPEYAIPDGGGGGVDLLRAGAIYGHDLSPNKARVLLMAALGTTRDRAKLQEMFQTI